MKIFKTWAALAALFICLVFTSNSSAQCGPTGCSPSGRLFRRQTYQYVQPQQYFYIQPVPVVTIPVPASVPDPVSHIKECQCKDCNCCGSRAFPKRVIRTSKVEFDVNAPIKVTTL